MEQLHDQHELQLVGKTSVELPLNAQFTDPNNLPDWIDEALPENDGVRDQIEHHARRANTITSCIDALPKEMGLVEAVKQGAVDAALAREAYDSLSELLSNPETQRIALYIPFELLSGVNGVDDDTLSAAANNFSQTYMDAWWSLLRVEDVRANFVDGDVLEEHLRSGDVPRVVKAAHIAPQLVASGLLADADIATLLRNADNPVLVDSLQEAFKEHESEDTESTVLLPLSLLPKILNAEIETVNAHDYGDATENRIAWLKESRIMNAKQALADQLSQYLLDPFTDHKEIDEQLFDDKDGNFTHVYVIAAQKALEVAAAQEPAAVAVLRQQFEQRLTDLAKHPDPTLHTAVTTLMRRWRNAGLVSDALLEKHDISLPDLSGNVEHNMSLLDKEIAYISDFTESLSSDELLSGSVYPVAMLYGSRLKGYGQEQSDIDLGIFVRPGVDSAMQDEIRTRLASYLGDDAKRNKPVEFWLAQKNGEVSLLDEATINPVDHTAVIADKYWSHMLFGAAWIGDESAIAELQSSLLPHYFVDNEVTVYGNSERSLYLEAIERDLLLYRLLHHGYERHHSPQSSTANTTAAQSGGALFWDSGYRKLATKLYAKSVFIPGINT